MPVAIATVDHGLRPESHAEACAVAALAKDLGLEHRILAWTGAKPGSGIQASARAMRYRLLESHALAIGARAVLTAHHADDQAETILIRLIAGSGPAGLVGMWKLRPLAQGIDLVRPFLSLAKADLVAYCEAHGLSYLRDPSNADDRYLRSRIRALVPLLAAEGLSAARLARLAERLARDERALVHAAEKLAAAARRPAGQGARVFAGATLLDAPEAVILRLVDVALDEIGNHLEDQVASRLERLERLVLGDLLPALARGERLRRTLRGVLVEVTPERLLVLTPAPPRRARQSNAKAGSMGSPAAETTDLLGKGRGAAYIGRECVASSPAASDARVPASLDRGR